jgi:hypothetical protein
MAATPDQAIKVYNDLVALIFRIFKIHVLGNTPLLGNKGLFADSNGLDIFLATKIRATFKSPKAPNGVKLVAADLGTAPVVASLAAAIADKMY